MVREKSPAVHRKCLVSFDLAIEIRSLFEVHHHDDYHICHLATGCGIRHCFQRAGQHRIVLANVHPVDLLQVAGTARSELFEHIRRYPGEEAADEHNFRKTMNSIQKRVGGRHSARRERTVSSIASLLRYRSIPRLVQC